MPQLSSLFTDHEHAFPDISPFTNWTEMLARFDVALTLADTGLIQWKRRLNGLQGLPFMAQLREVNDRINQTPYKEDIDLWGKSDFWATPSEFVLRGGDCEDFSIAKYLAIKALGYPESLLRIVILNDLRQRIPHAVLAVKAPNGLYILDNQIKSVTKAERIHHYDPIYSINADGWWYHGAQRLVA